MKKQFYRVKQLADQRTGRAEKTELLNEDLQNAEKKVDKIRQVCYMATKKLHPCMQSSGTDVEKRLKKLPHLALAQNMQETALVMGEKTVLGNILSICGNSQAEIAKDIAEYEMEVEKEVIAPFQSVLENDIPSINQNKKRLSKIGLDIDSLRSRYYAATKAKESPNSKDPAAAEAKAEQLKTQYEDELNKFESIKDLFITQMLTLVSKEDEYADHIKKLLTAQLEFHQRAVERLEEIMPQLNQEMDTCRPQSSVFGSPLEKHLKASGQSICIVMEECIRFLYRDAMDTEGLFRIAGQATKVRKLKASFDTGLVNLADCEYGPHVVTGALKQYLRELPEPLLTFELHNAWIESGSIRDRDERLQQLWTVVSKLPKENKDNLMYLIKFLSKIQQNSEVTKMTAHNLAIVIAPNLMWSIDDESGAMDVKNTGVLAAIVEALIEHADWFFPDEINFSEPVRPQDNNTTAAISLEDGKHVFKETVRKQLSSEEPSRMTLLDEAASLVDIKPINESQESESSEVIAADSPAILEVNTSSPEKKRAPPIPKQPLSPTTSKTLE